MDTAATKGRITHLVNQLDEVVETFPAGHNKLMAQRLLQQFKTRTSTALAGLAADAEDTPLEGLSQPDFR